VIAQLKLFLDRHRVHSGYPSQDNVFSKSLRKPLNLDALAREVIRPALEREKIPWHAGMRSPRLATNLHRLGVSDKAVHKSCVMQRDHHNEHLRENGHARRGEAIRRLGNEVFHSLCPTEASDNGLGLRQKRRSSLCRKPCRRSS